MMPGSRATKMFAIFFRKAWTGFWLYFAFWAALFSAAAWVTSTSSAVPLARPVSFENSLRTLLTLPGPSTICIVSSSTTPITSSRALMPSVSTCERSRVPTRNRVMQAALEVTFPLPPSSLSSCSLSSLSFISFSLSD